MNGDQAATELDALIGEAEDAAGRSLRRGRGYYFAGYALALLSVGASIVAGVLALGDTGAGLKTVGVIALIPAFCATIAAQLRLVEKANWNYRRRRRLKTLARETRFARLKGAPIDVLEAAQARLAAIETELDEAWSEGLAFTFAAKDAKG
jgi:hypothetical protein